MPLARLLAHRPLLTLLSRHPHELTSSIAACFPLPGTRRALATTRPALKKTPKSILFGEDDDPRYHDDGPSPAPAVAASAASADPLDLIDLPPASSVPILTHEEHTLLTVREARVRGLPHSIKALNKLLGTQKRFVLNEKDLVERFVRGSGPGGQAINKLSTCVDLLHVPTGLRVSAQPTRSLSHNRRSARKLLAEKIATADEESHAPSRQEVLGAKTALRKARARKKALRKYRALDEHQAQEEGEKVLGIEDPETSRDGRTASLSSRGDREK